jgi:hypothetical protein
MNQVLKTTVLPTLFRAVLGLAIAGGVVLTLAALLNTINDAEHAWVKRMNADKDTGAKRPQGEKKIEWLDTPTVLRMQRSYAGGDEYNEKYECKLGPAEKESRGSGLASEIKYLWLKTANGGKTARYVWSFDSQFSNPVFLRDSWDGSRWLTVEGGNSNDLCLDVFAPTGQSSDKSSYGCKIVFTRAFPEVRFYSGDGKSIESSGVCRRID